MRGLFSKLGISGRVLIAAAVVLSTMPSAFGQIPNYGRRYNKAQVERTIKKLENDTDRLKRDLDTMLDRTAVDRLPAEDRISDRIGDLERSTNGLRQHFDRTDSWWETRNEVQQVLQDARRVNTVVNRHREYFKLRNRWTVVKQDLNSLARYYNLPTLR
ncbi:MAG TPA: hypothetical protein VJ302_33185 [Blastocatellia bacterium]|nr:hypothetical protein [Blastocatellia bacterium]